MHKVTIIPRGRALGLTWQLPENDRFLVAKTFLEGEIAILMGGRLAEEVYLGQMTTGASNDIQRATELARRMVCEYGMSQMGPLHFSEDQHQPFLGRDITTQRATSEDTSRAIDAEVRRIVEDGYRKARELLVEHKREVELLANALLEYESLEKPDIKELFETGKIGRPTPSQILASAAAPAAAAPDPSPEAAA